MWQAASVGLKPRLAWLLGRFPRCLQLSGNRIHKRDCHSEGEIKDRGTTVSEAETRSEAKQL